ncbi:MAG: SGNH/GDSL hydrolase family protein [Bacteroidota bacterium]
MKFSKANIALFFCSTLAALLLGELVFQKIAPLEKGFNHHQLYCEYDSLLGWRKIPNNRGLHKTAEYEVLEEINSMGIRGEEMQMEKDSATFRILVLGDSFAEGYTVAFDELFSEIMRDSLAKKYPGIRFEVINAGTGGYSTDQELLWFESQGARFQPDLTLLLFCTNDPWYNAQSRYWRGFKPRFILEKDSLVLTNVPVPTLASRSLLGKVKDWLLLHSQLVRRVKNAKDNLKYAADGQAVPDEWKIYQTPTSPQMEEAWQVTAALLQRLAQKTKAAGSGLLVFYIPEKIEVYEADWQNFLAEYSLDEQFFDKAEPRRRLGFTCDSLGIYWLDPAEKFTEEGRRERLYFEKDWHWNALGNRLVGQLLADSIQF